MRNIQDKQQKKERDRELVYQLDGRPGLSTAVPLGLQHVLAMFTSNLAPILIIAGVCSLSGADTVIMVQCAMFVSGLTTFIQLYPLRLGKNYQVGAKLPIVMGTSFTFVPTASAIGAAGGIGAVRLPAAPEPAPSDSCRTETDSVRRSK